MGRSVSDQPQYRVAMCRMTLARVRALPQADDILARIDPNALAQIDDGGRLSWVPTQAFDQVTDAMFEVLGTEPFREFFAAQANGWSDSKLFGPLMEAARRIFGSNPAGHLKWIGRAWELTTRNMGSATATETASGVRVTYEDLPPSSRVERMVHSTYGSLYGIVASRGGTPDITIDDSKLAKGTLAFDVRW